MTRVLLATTWLIAALGCADRQVADRIDPLDEALRTAAPASSVVARVGDAIITTRDFEALARRRPSAVNPRALVDDLVLEEIAAAEAVRQGLLREPSVRHAARRVMVQALLTRAFEEPVRAAPIPDHFLRRAFDQNHWYYNRPEIREYEHLLVRSSPQDPVDRRTNARAMAVAILEALSARPPASLADVQADLRPRVEKAGLSLGYERSRANRLSVEKDFSDVLFETNAGRLGARVAESRFGYHVMRCVGIRPGKEQSFEQARDDVIRRAAPDWMRLRFRQWMIELRAKHRAQVTAQAHLLLRDPNGPAK
jgi:hypothetical protein